MNDIFQVVEQQHQLLVLTSVSDLGGSTSRGGGGGGRGRGSASCGGHIYGYTDAPPTVRTVSAPRV